MNSQKQPIDVYTYHTIDSIELNTNNKYVFNLYRRTTYCEDIYIPLNKPITVKHDEVCRIDLDSQPNLKEAYTFIAYLVGDKFDYYKYPLFVKSTQKTKEFETFKTVRVNFSNCKLVPYFSTLTYLEPRHSYSFSLFTQKEHDKACTLKDRKTLMKLDQVRSIEAVEDLLCVNGENHHARKLFVFQHECKFTIDDSIMHGNGYNICLLHVGEHTFRVYVEDKNMNKLITTISCRVNKKGYLSFKALK